MKSLEEELSPEPARAWTFVAWTFGLGWGAAALLRLMAGPLGGPIDPPTADEADWAATVLSILFFGLPVVVAVVMARRWEVSVNSWGLRMAPVSTLLTMPLVGLALVILATALPIAVGISEFDPSGEGEVRRLAEARSVEALELQLDLADSPQPLRRTLMRGLIAGLVFGLLLGPVVELPWRGLVFSELSGRGFAHAALVSAGLTAVWWLPFWLLVGAGFHSTGAALAFSAAYGLLGIAMAWVRARTGSILPAGILAVTVSALSEMPRLSTAGGTHLQLELCFLAAVGLLAGATLLWPPQELAEGETDG